MRCPGQNNKLEIYGFSLKNMIESLINASSDEQYGRISLSSFTSYNQSVTAEKGSKKFY